MRSWKTPTVYRAWSSLREVRIGTALDYGSRRVEPRTFDDLPILRGLTHGRVSKCVDHLVVG